MARYKVVYRRTVLQTRVIEFDAVDLKGAYLTALELTPGQVFAVNTGVIENDVERMRLVVKEVVE